MPNVILIKHSLPEIVPKLPAAQWLLGEEGRRRCIALAERLRLYNLAGLVSSEEPKAAETAAIVGERLGLPYRSAPNLHEHVRANVGWQSTEDFHAAVERFFAHPGELVFGEETADAALARFATAVDAALDVHRGGNLAIVAHGTVISLLVAARADVAPYPLWRRLGLPSFVVLALPGMGVVRVVEQVEE